jgi:hypothetical protein
MLHVAFDVMTDRRQMTTGEAERLLAEWAASSGGRDAVVLAAHRAGVSKHRIHLLTGIARTTLDRILSEENIMAIGSEVKSRQQEILRQRTIAALLGGGLASRDIRVFLGTDPTVIIQLDVRGTEDARIAVAARLIASFERDGLGLRQEPNGTAADEVYLADGCTAEVYELG